MVTRVEKFEFLEQTHPRPFYFWQFIPPITKIIYLLPPFRAVSPAIHLNQKLALSPSPPLSRTKPCKIVWFFVNSFNICKVTHYLFHVVAPLIHYLMTNIGLFHSYCHLTYILWNWQHFFLKKNWSQIVIELHSLWPYLVFVLHHMVAN